MVCELPDQSHLRRELSLRLPPAGVGSLAINTGGNREETVNYVVNGITLNNLTFSSISFQLPINTIQEFKLDNSTFSAQYGRAPARSST